jgi:hypothetical protein
MDQHSRPPDRSKSGHPLAQSFSRMSMTPGKTEKALPQGPIRGLIGRDSVPTGQFTDLGLFPG